VGRSQRPADAIYQYTGPDFTSATSPYTTSDFVSASFQLPAALGSNLTGFTVCGGTITCTIPFSVSDGVENVTNANSLLVNFNEISTNANALPTQWSFSNEFGMAGSFIDSGIRVGEDSANRKPQGSAFTTYTPGPQYWSVVPVPEPSTLKLVGISLSLLTVVRRRDRV